MYTQKKICSIFFQEKIWEASLLAGGILKYLCTARLTQLTPGMCPLLSTLTMAIIEEVFLQYALVRIIEYVFLLNFIFSKIIWDVLYWSQTHVRIYHSRLYFWRLIDNTFLMIWNKHKATQQKYFFNIQNYFFFRRFLLIVNALKAFIPNSHGIFFVETH